jgi:AI-2 transport protein TqsA
MGPIHESNGLRSLALAVIALGVVVGGLVVGSSFLIPIAIAILLWNLLEAIIGAVGSLSVGQRRVPRWLATILGVMAVLFGFYLVSSILSAQVDAIGAAWPRYAARLQAIVSDLTQWLGPERSAKLRGAVAELDLGKPVSALIASTQSLVVSLLLVVAYVGFMLVERDYISQKIAAIFPAQDKADDVALLLATISASVRRYIFIKSVISVLTAICSYVVLRWAGIDFAETWALLIFLLNYIPNIGSILGVAFPAFLASVQFDTAGHLMMLVVGLTAVQVAFGSVLEPILMGSSLNMSPLAIVLGLAFWGSVWGIVGMFLSIPIMALIMILCAHVPSWRWIAVLISKDGRIAA